ncbi:hypothetical protein [Vibrio metoecus]|uniref:hypothetical protein n=1 Tax=Vibrio metoecus TaxID=1481663 RepID=UPI000AE63C11|nr:hypothetical protein [Vibrio metoecus]
MTTKAKAAPKRKAAQNKRLPDGPDWTFELIERYHQEIRRVAEFYRLVVLTQTRLKSSPQSR